MIARFPWLPVILVLLPALFAPAADWPQFRGPNRDGATADGGTPTRLDDSTLLWKQKLPGHGSSSPITWGDKVFLTCYSGYGFDERDPGDKSSLVRHVLAFDLKSGKPLWDVPAQASPDEQDFRGFQALHGYASSTPATDGTTLYCFLGKNGVGALSLDGKPKWSQSVGERTHNWGSGTSPVLYKNLVIVNATVEGSGLVALNKMTGKQVWSQKGVRSAWNSPMLVPLKNGKTEVVISSQGEVLAFDADSGQPTWRSPGVQDYVCPSIVVHDEVAYAIGARAGMGVAVKAGGRGNVSPLWEVRKGSNVSSPVYHDGHLYWASESRGVVYCVNAETGDVVYEQRLEPRPDRIYASATLAGDKIYYVSRNNGVYVVAAKPQFELLAHNPPLDRSVFNGSPAVVDGKLLLRSDENLYCFGK